MLLLVPHALTHTSFPCLLCREAEYEDAKFGPVGFGVESLVEDAESGHTRPAKLPHTDSLSSLVNAAHGNPGPAGSRHNSTDTSSDSGVHLLCWLSSACPLLAGVTCSTGCFVQRSRLVVDYRWLPVVTTTPRTGARTALRHQGRRRPPAGLA